MQTSKRQCSWRILVRAKAKHLNFTFRLRATSLGPNWTLHGFSFILKLRKFVFRLTSHGPVPIADRSRLGLIRARVVDVIQKFQSRISAKNRAASGDRGWIDERQKLQDLILTGFWGLLAFLAQLEHIWKKYGKGVLKIILACVGFMGVLLMKKGRRAKSAEVRGLRNCVAVIAACSLLYMLLGDYSYWDGMAKQVWDLIS